MDCTWAWSHWCSWNSSQPQTLQCKHIKSSSCFLYWFPTVYWVKTKRLVLVFKASSDTILEYRITDSSTICDQQFSSSSSQKQLCVGFKGFGENPSLYVLMPKGIGSCHKCCHLCKCRIPHLLCLSECRLGEEKQWTWVCSKCQELI